MSNEQQPQNNEEQELHEQQVTDENVVEETAEQADPAAQRIEELETALAAAQATINDQKDSVLRAKADSENARRRAEAEVEKARKFALERFAGELLPVADNLERALQLADVENETYSVALADLIGGILCENHGPNGTRSALRPLQTD